MPSIARGLLAACGSSSSCKSGNVLLSEVSVSGEERGGLVLSAQYCALSSATCMADSSLHNCSARRVHLQSSRHMSTKPASKQQATGIVRRIPERLCCSGSPSTGGAQGNASARPCVYAWCCLIRHEATLRVGRTGGDAPLSS